MTTHPKPTLPPGVERLPSGRFRAKLRDPTREGAWMPGGNFATPEEAADYRKGLLAELADLLRDGAVAGDDSLEACDGVSQSTDGAVSAVRAVSAGRKGL